MYSTSSFVNGIFLHLRVGAKPTQHALGILIATVSARQIPRVLIFATTTVVNSIVTRPPEICTAKLETLLEIFGRRRRRSNDSQLEPLIKFDNVIKESHQL